MDVPSKAQDTPRVVVDALGLLCPLPILRTERAIARIGVGEVLALHADDEGVKDDLPAWCRGTGHDLVSIETRAPAVDSARPRTEFYCLVRKKAEPSGAGA